MDIIAIENTISNLTKNTINIKQNEENQKIKNCKKDKKTLLLKNSEVLSDTKSEKIRYIAPDFLKFHATPVSLPKGEKAVYFHFYNFQLHIYNIFNLISRINIKFRINVLQEAENDITR